MIQDVISIGWYTLIHTKIKKLPLFRKFALRRAAPQLRSQHQLTRQGLSRGIAYTIVPAPLGIEPNTIKYQPHTRAPANYCLVLKSLQLHCPHHHSKTEIGR